MYVLQFWIDESISKTPTLDFIVALENVLFFQPKDTFTKSVLIKVGNIIQEKIWKSSRVLADIIILITLERLERINELGMSSLHKVRQYVWGGHRYFKIHYEILTKMDLMTYFIELLPDRCPYFSSVDVWWGQTSRSSFGRNIDTQHGKTFLSAHKF